MPKSPSQNPPKNRHPREHNLDTIDLKLSTSDGVNIAGWHVKCENSKRIIIYLHENAGSISTINFRYRGKNSVRKVFNYLHQQRCDFGGISWIL